MTAPPVVDARRLGLRLGSGWAYRGIDLVVPPASVVVLQGQHDSWRTALMLTLALDMEPTDGTLTVCGHPVPSAAVLARKRVALAQLPAKFVANPTHRVRDCVTAHLVMSDLSTDNDVFEAAADVVGLKIELPTPVAALSTLDRRLLAVALGVTAPVELLLLDDADRDLTDGEQATLWRALRAVSRTGAAVVAGAAAPWDLADQVVTLPEGSSEFIP